MLPELFPELIVMIIVGGLFLLVLCERLLVAAGRIIRSPLSRMIIDVDWKQKGMITFLYKRQIRKNLHRLCWTKLTAILVGTKWDGASLRFRWSVINFCFASSVASMFLIFASIPKSTSGIPLSIWLDNISSDLQIVDLRRYTWEPLAIAYLCVELIRKCSGME